MEFLKLVIQAYLSKIGRAGLLWAIAAVKFEAGDWAGDLL